MPTDHPPLTPDLQAALQHRIVRAFFISVALVCLLAALVAPLLGGPQPPLVRAVTVVGYGGMVVLAAIGSRAAPATAVRLMGPLLLSGFLLVGLLSLLTGWGLLCWISTGNLRRICFYQN